MHEFWQWAIAIGVPVVSGVGALLIRAHNRHVQRIDELSRINSDAHKDIHVKIDALDNKSEERHHIVRDKIEKIWQHLVQGK